MIIIKNKTAKMAANKKEGKRSLKKMYKGPMDKAKGG